MAKNSKNRRNKVSLVFDEDKRREFLTGFHKRKLQRKKEAKERLERDLKSERKRLKLEAKESYKKLVVSHRSIPELENFLLKDEYEEDEVTVTIRELSTNQIALDNNLIGANRPIKTEESVCTAATPEADYVPGMSPQRNKPESSSNLPRTFKDAREIKKLLKKEATKKVKKSKVFNKISQIERSKQRKRSQYQEKVKLKMRKKH